MNKIPTADTIWDSFNGAEVACQDCFEVTITFDPAHGPAYFASSCSLERELGPFTTWAELRDAVFAAKVLT